MKVLKEQLNIIGKTLEILNIHIEKRSIKDFISKHPNSSSLLSISDAFTDWKIDNLPVHLSDDELEQIHKFPMPFLTKIKNGQERDEFILVTDLNKNTVTYLNNKGSQKHPFQEFKNQWTKISLLLFPSENSGVIENIKARNKRKWSLTFQITLIGLFLVFLSIGLINIWQIGGSLFLALSFLKIFGLMISIVLLMRELGVKEELVNTICKIGKSDCNAVLDKQETKLFGVLSWTELGLIYFSFGLLFIFLGNTSSEVSSIPLLTLLNILTLMFIPYSLYYQQKIAKAFCTFCLITLSVFLTESVLLYLLNDWSFNYSLYTISLICISALLPISIIYIFKPFYLETNQLKVQNNALNRFKYNVDNFNLILKSQPKNGIPIDISPVVLGNTEAKNEITVITNPNCKPCQITHTFIDYYLERPNMFEDIKFTLLFSVGSDKANNGYQIAKKILQAFLEDKEKGNKVIEQWYQQNDFTQWCLDFTFDEKYTDTADVLLDNHQNWLIKNNIDFTPAVFLNGYLLPQDFTIKDLKFFL